MTVATLVDEARAKAAGYIIEGGAGYFTLRHASDSLDHSPDPYLMIGDHGCVSPTRWEAVAEALKRLDDDVRHRKDLVAELLQAGVRGDIDEADRLVAVLATYGDPEHWEPS